MTFNIILDNKMFYAGESQEIIDIKIPTGGTVEVPVLDWTESYSQAQAIEGMTNLKSQLEKILKAVKYDGIRPDEITIKIKREIK